MKKYLILMVVALAFTFTSCDQTTEPGGTSVQEMGGDWWVTYEYESSPGVWEDAGVGHVLLTTYNTTDNKSTEMWVNDNGNFWNFKSIVKVDYTAKTFLTTDSVSTNAVKYPDETVMFTNGKILKGAAKTPSGVAADSIVFYVGFNDDSAPTTYKVAGFRRTGFPADNY